jgi:tetratricopeptide (TPR) repeat protein
MAAGFDLKKFQALFDSRADVRKDLVYMARTAEAAERYDDMCKFMRELVEWCSKNTKPLTVEERNLLSVAYKNVIGTRRASWRTLNAEVESKNDVLIAEYKTQVEKELKKTCEDVLQLLENTLVKQADKDVDNGEPKVFYLKMTGDYYRYLAESVTDKQHDEKAAEYYKQAYELAQEKLKPTHPIRLGLALNYSVCFYEILKDKKAACDLAKKAFDEAISKLDKLEEADYKDSTLIMQLLRDNLTLWTSSDNDGDGEQVQVEDLSDDEN